MPPPASAVTAARAAVAVDPASTSLRLHLSTLLLDSGGAAEALPHIEAVLGSEPRNVEALLQATRACEYLGDHVRAAAYRGLATQISTGGEAAAPATGTGPGQGRHGRLTLADVGGLEHVKHRLQVTLLIPLLDPGRRPDGGGAEAGGLLLFGPPGCGKTLLGRAVAGELGAHFIEVSVPEMARAEPGTTLDVGMIFELARRHRPAVVFFDELERLPSLGSHGGSEPGVAGRLLAELASGDNDGVVVIGASDQPWQVEAELLGPGHFDRHVLVLPPDRGARVAILRHALRGRESDALNLEVIADQLDGYSATDIAAVCEVAVEVAAGPGRARPVTRDDLEEALGAVARSTARWFEAARNLAVFSSAGGMYDDLVVYMRSRRMI